MSLGWLTDDIRVSHVPCPCLGGPTGARGCGPLAGGVAGRFNGCCFNDAPCPPSTDHGASIRQPSGVTPGV